MKLYPFCDPYVWENVKVLLVTGFTVKKHKHGKCASEYVNNIVLVFLYAFLIGLVLSVLSENPASMPVLLGAAFLYSLPSMWELFQMRSESEGFADATPEPAPSSAEVYEIIGSEAASAKLTLPKAKNPFMNVLVNEIKDNPSRPKAASVLDSSVKVTLDDFFRTEFNADPTDVFGRSQSQRQFISMPSTSIPNDQGSYQDWLYRIPGKTCKEGGREACLPGTDGGPITWMNVNPS